MLTNEKRLEVLNLAARFALAHLNTKPRVNGLLQFTTGDLVVMLRGVPAACQMLGVRYLPSEWRLDEIEVPEVLAPVVAATPAAAAAEAPKAD